MKQISRGYITQHKIQISGFTFNFTNMSDAPKSYYKKNEIQLTKGVYITWMHSKLDKPENSEWNIMVCQKVWFPFQIKLKWIHIKKEKTWKGYAITPTHFWALISYSSKKTD